MSKDPVNVLHIISPGSGNFGGIEAYLMNYYANMNHDKVHFDFAFCGTNTMKLHMKDEVFAGSIFIEFKALKGTGNDFRNWKQLICSIRDFIKSRNYRIVEVHTASPMIQAMCGIALRPFKEIVKIAHSHALQEPPINRIVSCVSKVCVQIIRSSYDFFFACSNAAGEMYGVKVYNSDKFRKVNNAIDTSLFAFDEKLRNRVREEQEIKDGCFVVGHVARLSEEKNQVFLIDIFSEIKKIKNNSKLWIVGEGPSRDDIKKRIEILSLSDSVVLFGQRSDVSYLLQGMDAFVITSHLEGFCISAIESQAAGLPTFVSSGVPEECKVTKLAEQIGLSADAKLWAKHILDKSQYIRQDTSVEIKNKGYDIRLAGQELERFYCEFHTFRRITAS